MASEKKNLRKGWMNPYLYNQNTLFDEDYEEPTYLSFKLEFGNWGASINTEEADKLIWEAQGQTYATYDDMPMGLFNPTFEIPGGSYTASKINSVSAYSAVEYLYRRNEDTRAEYLQAFINGWYDLQKNYQGYFQEISGIKSLFNIKTAQGRRLEDGTTITIKCLEDTLDQRIRYLLTLYRKAAWDDVWQRWVLPDIYRYFHLYIYISENRIFQLPASAATVQSGSQITTAANKSLQYVASDFNNTEIITKMLQNITADNYAKLSLNHMNVFNGDRMYMNPNSLILTAFNGFAPVTVLDCGPCEFDITTVGSYNDSYSVNNTNLEEMSFGVIVKNVKFYERNPLMWRLKTSSNSKNKGLQYVKDFANVNEMKSYENSSKSFNDYISQSFFNNDEIMNFIDGSTYETSEANNHYKSVQNMLSLYDALYEEWGGWKYSPSTDSSTYGSLNPQSFKNIFYQLQRFMEEEYRHSIADQLRREDVFDNTSYWIWSELQDDLRNYYTYQYNAYQRLLHDYEYYDNIWYDTYGDRSWATDLDGGPWGVLSGPDLTSNIPDQNLTPLDLTSDIKDQNLVRPDLTSNIPEQNLTPLDLTSNIPEQNLVPLDADSEIPDQNMVPLSQEAEIPDQNLVSLDGTSNIPEQEMISVEQPNDRSWATEFDGWGDGDASDKNQMTSINQHIQPVSQNLVSPDMDVSLSEMELTELKYEDFEINQQMTGVEGGTYSPSMKGISPVESDVNTQIRNVELEESEYETSVLNIRPDLSDREIDMDMVGMDYNDYKSNASLVPNVQKELKSYVSRRTIEAEAYRDNNIQEPQIRNIELDETTPQSPVLNTETDNQNIQKASLQSANLEYQSAEDIKIKPVSPDNVRIIRPDVKSVQLETSDYISPGINSVQPISENSDINLEIKEVSPELTSEINSEIKGGTLDNININASEIKNVSPETSKDIKTEIKEVSPALAANVTPSIKPVRIIEPAKLETEIKPVFIEEIVSENSSIKSVNLYTENIDEPSIKGGEVSIESQHIPTTDMVRPEYDTTASPSINNVRPEIEVDVNTKISGGEINYDKQNETRMRDVSVYTDSLRPMQIMQKVDMEDQSIPDMLYNISELKKEYDRLKSETEKLKNQLKGSEMTEIPQPKDRSWATEFDGWNPKDDSDRDSMVSVGEKQKHAEEPKKKIKGPNLAL